MLVNKQDRAEYYKAYNAANRERKIEYQRQYYNEKRQELNGKVKPLAENKDCRLARRWYWIMDRILRNDG